MFSKKRNGDHDSQPFPKMVVPPEYSDPAGGSIPVAPETILAKERRPEEEIDKLRTKAAQFTQSDELFNRIKE